VSTERAAGPNTGDVDDGRWLMNAVLPDRRSLVGSVVRLDPVAVTDADGLFAALDDPRVYAAGFGGGPAGRPAGVADMADWLRVAGTDDRRVAPYTVRLLADGPAGPAGTIVGTSSLGDVSLPDERIHLGWTAYSPTVWGTAVNPDCKLLLLAHAFDDCGFGRVKIQTDKLNSRSQGAITRLGAVREGVLRRHQVRADGSFRDTVVFSILRDEWPGVRAGLVSRLADS
jgi:RimJ/RimL family protein N-acetyltransferase